MAGLFAIVGGILQGIGANIQRYTNSDIAWGGLGVMIGGGLSVWFARRLRWWLLIYIPAIWLLMIPIAVGTEEFTAGFVSRAVYETGACRGWRDVNASLAPISASVATYTADMNDTENPDREAAHRWAASAAAIRQQYEALDHPPVLTHYVELSVKTFRNYEQGFNVIADGDYDDGVTLVDQGDSTLTQAKAAFRAANAERVR